MTRLDNVVEQVWVEKGEGCFLIKYKKLNPNPKNKNKQILLASVYDEFHAREMRLHFRRMYGLNPNAISSADYLCKRDVKYAVEQFKVIRGNDKTPIAKAHQQMKLNLPPLRSRDEPLVDIAALASELLLQGLSQPTERKSHARR